MNINKLLMNPLIKYEANTINYAYAFGLGKRAKPHRAPCYSSLTENQPSEWNLHKIINLIRSFPSYKNKIHQME